MASKAVIFTHIPIKKHEVRAVNTESGAGLLGRRVIPSFKAYLKCHNIGIVYAYIDIGLQLTLEQLSKMATSDKKNELIFSIDDLGIELRTINCLKAAVDDAIQELIDDPEESFDRGYAPRFQFIGLSNLLNLYSALYTVDPDLVSDLGGADNQLTYDSPKFVEAVIRIARGSNFQYPILRFDDDVEVNEEAIEVLLKAVAKYANTHGQLYNFFSGGYGIKGHDMVPLNDFAVRIHWLIDRETEELPNKGFEFLRDLGEIGATQVSLGKPMSSNMQEFIRSNRDGKSSNRKLQQVISGAGLYMSLSAVKALPPFMNFQELTTWVDDHLKRCLHENVGHLNAEVNIEHLPDALFRQERHPEGVSDENIDWAKTDYFERLLRGCIVHALVVNYDGTPGLLAVEIKSIINEQLQIEDFTPLKASFEETANKSAEHVVSIWLNTDYGSLALTEWCQDIENDIPKICETTVNDILAYLRLVVRWPKYVRTIEKLTRIDAYWLFRRVD